MIPAEMQNSITEYNSAGGDISELIAYAQTLASSSKTPLGLNKWIPTDKPTMADFNEDNRIIDEKLRELGEKKANCQTTELSLRTGFTFDGDGYDTRISKVGNIATINLRIKAENDISSNQPIVTLPSDYIPSRSAYVLIYPVYGTPGTTLYRGFIVMKQSSIYANMPIPAGTYLFMSSYII